MIQIIPQMRILVAVEPVDGRKGIDSLAQLCQERLLTDPFSGSLFVFGVGAEPRFAYWSMTARDSGSHRSGYPRGVFAGGRKAGARARWRGVWQRINCKCCWRRATRPPPRRRRRGGR